MMVQVRALVSQAVWMASQPMVTNSTLAKNVMKCVKLVTMMEKLVTKIFAKLALKNFHSCTLPHRLAWRAVVRAFTKLMSRHVISAHHHVLIAWVTNTIALSVTIKELLLLYLCQLENKEGNQLQEVLVDHNAQMDFSLIRIWLRISNVRLVSLHAQHVKTLVQHAFPVTEQMVKSTSGQISAIKNVQYRLHLIWALWSASAVDLTVINAELSKAIVVTNVPVHFC